MKRIEFGIDMTSKLADGGIVARFYQGSRLIAAFESGEVLLASGLSKGVKDEITSAVLRARQAA